MRRGFTILELLAASLLLSMLVTVLAMLVNQSSIAWRTGVADVAELEDTREQLGTFHDIEDDALPGLGDENCSTGANDDRTMRYRTISLFAGWDGQVPTKNNCYRKDGNFRGRLYDSIQAGGSDWQDIQDARKGNPTSLANGKTRSRSAYIVGVRSAGPDRRFGTSDDISTLPEESE